MEEEAVKPGQAHRTTVPRQRRLPSGATGRISSAEENGAPTAFVERLRNLPLDARFPALVRSRRHWSAKTRAMKGRPSRSEAPFEWRRAVLSEHRSGIRS